MLKRMPGWPADFALEVRDGSIGGPLLERVGPSDAKVRRIIAKQGELHEAYDVSGRILGLPTSGRQSLYDAALRALPAEQLNALGLSERERSHGFKLRNELFEHAVNDRPAVMALLRGESLDKTEPLPACVQASPPAPQCLPLTRGRWCVARADCFHCLPRSRSTISWMSEAPTTWSVPNRSRRMSSSYRCCAPV
ncbi:hypothetical protein [Pseudomonas sp. S3_A03]